MKDTAYQPGAFTLLELLLLICLLGIVAVLFFPTGPRIRPPRTAQVRLDMAQIAMAILNYESAYSQLPVSKEALAAAGKSGADFTYGTSGTGSLKTPGGKPAVVTNAESSYQANNSEVMAILVGLEVFDNGQATINKGHAYNPQKIKFLNAKHADDTTSPGIGRDGVYRDPWGNP